MQLDIEADRVKLSACEEIAEYPIDERVWHQLRAEGVGGSDAGVLMGASNYETPLSLWMLKTGRTEPGDGSEQADVGNILEGFLRREVLRPWLIQNGYGIGIEVIDPYAMYRSLEYPFMQANVDGFLRVDGETVGLEIKTADGYQLPYWKDDALPEHYWWQVQHYMAVTGLPAFWVFGLVGNRRMLRIVERNDGAIADLIAAEDEFWGRVEQNDPLWAPLPTGHSRDMDALLELGNPQTDDVADLDNEEELIRVYLDLGEQQKDIKEQREYAKQRIIAAMGSAKYGQVGDLRVTFTRYTTRRLDSKRLKMERPEVAAEYETETESGRLSVKEAS